MSRWVSAHEVVLAQCLWGEREIDRACAELLGTARQSPAVLPTIARTVQWFRATPHDLAGAETKRGRPRHAGDRVETAARLTRGGVVTLEELSEAARRGKGRPPKVPDPRVQALELILGEICYPPRRAPVSIVAELLGCSERTVLRLRSKGRQQKLSENPPNSEGRYWAFRDWDASIRDDPRKGYPPSWYFTPPRHGVISLGNRLKNHESNHSNLKEAA